MNDVIFFHLLLCALNMFDLAKLTKVGNGVWHVYNAFFGNQQCLSLLLADLIRFHCRRIWERFSGANIFCMMWATCVSLHIGRNLNIFWSSVCFVRLSFSTWHEHTSFFPACLLRWWPVWMTAWRVRRAFTNWTPWWVVEMWLEIVADNVLNFLREPIRKRISQIFRKTTASFCYLLIELVQTQIECIASRAMGIRTSWDSLRQRNIKASILLVVSIQLFGEVINLNFVLPILRIGNFCLLSCDRVIFG